MLTEKRGDCITALFVGRDKICILDLQREVYISSFDGSNLKKWPILKKNLVKIENVFPGPLGKILVHSDTD